MAEGVRVRAVSDTLGKVNFWIILIGFNLTFGPMHILGLQGMPRRTYTYKDGYGFNFWNMVSTVGAFIIAVSFLVFFFNIIVSRRKAKAHKLRDGGRPVGRSQPRVDDPVARRRPTTSTRCRRSTRSTSSGTASTARTSTVGWCASPPPRTWCRRARPPNVHLPSPSYWPLVLAVGLPVRSPGA